MSTPDTQSLVTGGAGFIGSHIAERLVELGHHVRVVDNLSTGSERNISHLRDRIEFTHGDLCDPETCRSAVRDVDTVFHVGDQFLRALNDQLTRDIQLGYPFFGNAVVMAAKLIWDIPAAWAFLCPQMFNSIFLDRETHVQLRQVTARFFSLTQRMQRLFREWDSRSPGRCSYKFIDYLTIPFLKKLRASNLRGNKSTEELLEDRIANMERFEELAQVLFLLAVEDIAPECLDRLPSPTWLNAWSVSLNSEKWEADGLFKPISKPRDLYQLREEIRSLFRFDTFSH